MHENCSSWSQIQKVCDVSPPAVSISDNRNFVMSFSDYVANTFFESLYAEHIGGTQLNIPGIKTLFDKHCPMCRSVIAVKFADNDEVQSRARLWNARKAFVIGADARLACHRWYVFDSSDCELYILAVTCKKERFWFRVLWDHFGDSRIESFSIMRSPEALSALFQRSWL